MLIDFGAPLPSADSVFAALPDAPRVDSAELNRIPGLAEAAAAALDSDALDALYERVGLIAARNARNLSVMRLVKRAQSAVRLKRAAGRRQLRGMGL